MIAGLLIISVISGAAAATIALAMAQPFWVALLAYPVTGMIALLVVAALLSLRGSARRGPPGLFNASLMPLQAGSRS